MVALGSLARSLGAAPDLIKRLERAGVIVPLGRDRAGQIWVAADVRRQVERVQSLIGAGYAERDIALVIGRVEREPGRTRVDEVVGLAELAKAAAVTPEDLRRWVTGALVVPWGVAEDGDPLFVRAALGTAKALAALETLGLGADAPALAAFLARDKAPRTKVPDAAIAALHARVDERLQEVEAAARILRKVLPQLGLAAAPKPPRRLVPRRRLKLPRAR